MLRREQCLKSSSKIFKLDPFIDKNEILRVAGRIQRSSISEEIQNPILMPKTSKITEVIVRWCHQRVAHAGRGLTINEIRSSGFWIRNCNSVVRSVIGKCVRCKQLRGKFQQQKMANLPGDQVSMEVPFSYCGVDVFGPF